MTDQMKITGLISVSATDICESNINNNTNENETNTTHDIANTTINENIEIVCGQIILLTRKQKRNMVVNNKKITKKK